MKVSAGFSQIGNLFLLGKITITATTDLLAYDIWTYNEEITLETRKYCLLLDVNPLHKGSFGQIIIVQQDSDCVLDVIPGGIMQLLCDYLTPLSSRYFFYSLFSSFYFVFLRTCTLIDKNRNLVATLGMEAKSYSTNLPNHLENEHATFNPKKKNKKLGSILLFLLIFILL